MKKIEYLFLTFLLIPLFASSQNISKDEIGITFIKNSFEALELYQDDVSNMLISDFYQTKHNGVTHIYYNQAFKDIPVYNAFINLNISKENEILHYGNTFINALSQKINSSEAKIDPQDAILNVAHELGIKNPENASLLKRENNGQHIFNSTSYSEGNIIVQKMYFPLNDKEVRLVWDVSLNQKASSDSWSSRIDAVTGEIVDHESITIYCNHAPNKYHNHNAECRTSQKEDNYSVIAPFPTTPVEGAQYLVYPVPYESPLNGPQELLTDPHYPGASPFGWHDIDGVEGPEFTITRGNNVHAYEDQDDDFVSSNNEPDGGMDLIFNFPHAINEEPDSSIEADVVNLFYSNNIIHDVTYLAGFDEVSGNYQTNNYGKGGLDGDYVVAHALDGSGSDNANFVPSRDGSNGNMNMFRWNIPQTKLFGITQPEVLNVTYQNGAAGGGWGFDITYSSVDVEAEIAPAFSDDPQFANNVCDPVINPEEIDGKIALIYRGRCEFGEKSLHAQDAGAIAVIICNVPGAGGDPTSDGNDPISGGMGGGDFGLDITIPVLALGYNDCNTIVATIESGTPVIGRILPILNEGPAQVSAGFDNGVVFHEYGHGISNRLTGGPNTSSCLGADESMGEGWSDFFALALTVEHGDTGADPRGIGNFVDGREVDGPGIRRFPYSTDMSINPQTFRDIKATTAPHPLGEVWVDMLWDIYWGYVEKYEYDADWNNTESGNFKAMQLVLDGMKMQACNPGFIEGRNAIVAAELANTNGENQCLVWDAFARRGLGFFADGGSSNNRNDGSEDFSPLPSCQKTMKIYKNMPGLIPFDEEVEVQLVVANHKDETIENAVVTDIIPEGLSYVPGSATRAETVMGDQIIFDYDALASQQWDTIYYKVQHNNSINSTILSNNTVESAEELSEWQRELIQGETNIFVINSNSIFPTYSGESSWFVQELDQNTESSIRFNDIEVVGQLPVVRFWHRINTEFTRNGGFVEISTDGMIWNDVKDLFIRNGYECPLQFTTFAIPALQAFSGRTDPDEYIDSYIDLSSYKGQTVSLKFRFGCNPGAGNTENDETFPLDGGWFLDDLDLIDLVINESQACIQTVDDQACTAIMSSALDPQFVTGIEESEIAGLEFSVYPNPAENYITLNINSESTFDAMINLSSMNGQQILNTQMKISSGINYKTLNTSDLVSGMYVLQILNNNQISTKKIMILK